MRRIISALVALCGVSTLPETPAYAEFEPAGSADDFVDRIGVCTHLGYADTPYGYAFDSVKRLLGESGIRHIRDSWNDHMEDLFLGYGVRTTLIVGPPQEPTSVPAFVRERRPLLDAIEGPNESDLFPNSARYKGLDFPEGPRLYMDELQSAIRSDPTLASLSIIAPSSGTPSGTEHLAPLRSFDTLVMHPYAGGEMPSASLERGADNPIRAAYSLLGPEATLRPIIATASGYHTALGSNVVIGGAQPGVSERAQAKYLPRQLCVYWNAGIARTFFYEFVDEFPDYAHDERTATDAEACFGLVKRDMAPKPALVSLKNLIAILSEQRWDTEGQRWTPAPAGRSGVRFAAGALDFSLSGETHDVRHTLLAKAANGHYYLLLWREIPSFDPAKREDVINTDAAITLTFGTRIRGGRIYRPGVSAEARQAFDTTDHLSLWVPDDLLIVEIAPAAGAGERNRPIPWPGDLAQRGSEASRILLQWSPVKGAAGYFVYRMGAYIGRTAETSYADTGLRSGSGYTYAIRAYDTGGHVSAPISAVLRTANASSDITVTDVTSGSSHGF